LLELTVNCRLVAGSSFPTLASGAFHELQSLGWLGCWQGSLQGSLNLLAIITHAQGYQVHLILPAMPLTGDALINADAKMLFSF